MNKRNSNAKMHLYPRVHSCRVLRALSPAMGGASPDAEYAFESSSWDESGMDGWLVRMLLARILPQVGAYECFHL